jgi:hypothetical protein
MGMRGGGAPKLIYRSHGELAGEGKEGEGEEEAEGTARGLHGELLGAPWGGAARSNSLLVAALSVFCFLREKKETAGRRREERAEEKEKRKKKKKRMGEICKHGNFWKTR